MNIPSFTAEASLGGVDTTEWPELTLTLMGPYNQQDHIVPSVRSFARLCVSPSIHSLYRPKPLSGAIIVGLPIATRGLFGLVL